MEYILKNKKLFSFIFWLWVAIILYFTLTPSSPQMKVDVKEQSFRLDYLLHFLVYFSLSILYLLWKADNFLNVKVKYLIYFLGGALIVSGLIEYVQLYIPGRSFNPIDYLSNAAGIILGVVIPKIIFNNI